MKSRELMIGDWVECDTLYPRQVQITMQDLLWISQGKVANPIPLTPEILEKNGFAIKSMIARIWSDYIIEYEFYAHTISIKNGINTLYLKVTNVHELQHALRLCGLSGQADNFKVLKGE